MLQDLVLPLGQSGWTAPSPGFLTDWEILPPVRAGRHIITVHRDECFIPGAQSHTACPIRVWRFAGGSDGGVEELQWGVNVPIAVSTGLVFDHQVEDYDYTPNLQFIPALVTVRFTFEPAVARQMIGEGDTPCVCGHLQATHYGAPVDGEYPCTRCDCERFTAKPSEAPKPKLVLVGRDEPPSGGFPWSLVNSKSVPWSNH